MYEKIKNDLPNERRVLSGIIKKPKLSFHEVKGIIEQLLNDNGIKQLVFKALESSGHEIEVSIGKEKLGTVEILDSDLIDFELDFDMILAHVSSKKVFTPLAKYPPIIEDIALIVRDEILTGDIIENIKKQSPLIVSASLLDKYESTRTFHIVYQDSEKNLTNEEITEIRKKILQSVKEKFDVKPKL